ncbi:sialidase family protein [Gorillibacterium sp. CAU 1737]|uniref:WD40/YVTN/BNR-like repeat-containing protein n=1 Tax=Gorillibacterium sp. CAU 1737 TaxID=3140362 RepID=UPI00326018D5
MTVLWLVAMAVLSGCSPQSKSAHGSEAPHASEITQETSPEHDATDDSTEETFFLNEDLGWKAVFHFQGMAHEDMQLYQTKNAGKDWRKIADSIQPGSTLPGGVKSGVVFTSETTGWMTTNTPWQGKVGFYKSIDGGVTWSEAPLQIPDELSDTQIRVGAPLFLTESLGILLTRPDSTDHTLVYMTRDGGQSWESHFDTANYESSDIRWSLSLEGMDVTFNHKTQFIRVE